MSETDNTEANEAALAKFEENAKKYAKILAKCWSDPEFMANFKANPRDVLTAHGFKVPASKSNITVVEDSDETLHLVIPPKPVGLEKLSEDDLESAAGGYCGCARCGGCARCAGCAGCYHPVARGVAAGAVAGSIIANADDDDDW